MNGTLDSVKLGAGRLWAAQRLPYFATALFALTATPAPGIATMAVDRHWRLYVDPVVLTGWSVAQLGSVLVHEVSHLLRDHAGRGDDLGVDSQTAHDWNIACDAEINDDLVAGGLDLPSPVTPKLLGWPKNRLAEEYYRRIRRARPQTRAKLPEPTECGSAAHGRSRPWESDGDDAVYEGEATLIRRSVARDVIAHQRAQGLVPDGLRRWAEATLRPTVDWRRVLGAQVRRAVQHSAGRVDYSYRRPSRRASALTQVIQPGLYRPVPSVAIVVDTSASMSDDHLTRVLAEIDGILKRIGTSQRPVPVIACDEAVEAVTNARRASDVVLKGGGGTDMGAGIAAVQLLRPTPQVVVVLTDGETPWPTQRCRGISVVVGLIGASASIAQVPAWASTVEIDPKVA